MLSGVEAERFGEGSNVYVDYLRHVRTSTTGDNIHGCLSEESMLTRLDTRILMTGR